MEKTFGIDVPEEFNSWERHIVLAETGVSSIEKCVKKCSRNFFCDLAAYEGTFKIKFFDWGFVPLSKSLCVTSMDNLLYCIVYTFFQAQNVIWETVLSGMVPPPEKHLVR